MQAKYNRANGYEADCEVIYGDTDSVMVNFKVDLLAEMLQHATVFDIDHIPGTMQVLN